MKKVLLAILICSYYFAFSQFIEPGDPYNKYYSESDYLISNNFRKIYYSKDTISNNVRYFKADRAIKKVLNNGVFSSQKIKSGDNSLSYTVSQPYGITIPHVNLCCGEGKRIDINNSQLPNISLEFTPDSASLANTYSGRGIKIKFSLTDIHGTRLDHKGDNAGTSSQFKDEISIYISKTGEFIIPSSLPTGTITTQKYGTSRITIDFSQAYEAVYPKLDSLSYTWDESCIGDIIGDGGVKGASKPKTNFDYSNIASFQMTFTDLIWNAGDCYYHYELTNFKFELSNINIACSDVLGNDKEKILNKHEFIAYPNPTKGGFIQLSATATNIRIYDSFGTEVFSANTASEINVDEFRKGLYTILSSKGTTRFVLE